MVEFLENKMDEICKALQSYTDQWPNLLVYDAAKYSLLSEGKRIRPILTIEAFKVVGGTGDTILPFACALEMIHTSSLIVDDLIDEDQYRRGKLACHIKFGVGTAVLASHLISSEALKLITNTKCLYEVIDTVNLMCVGQDQEIAEYKTGSLIRAAVRIGAIVGGATEEQLDALTKYGEQIGLLFQIRDDILDGDRQDEHLELDLSCLDIFGHKADKLREIAQFIITRTK